MYKLYLILILLITFIPDLSNNNKVRLSILVNNKISIFFLLVLITFVLLEDYTTGILLIILYHTIILNKLETIEGFHNYYN